MPKLLIFKYKIINLKTLGMLKFSLMKKKKKSFISFPFKIKYILHYSTELLED